MNTSIPGESRLSEGTGGARSAPRLQEPLVMIVDDDRATTEALADIFAREKIPCCAFMRAAPAIAALERSDSIRVILTDVAMPEISGLEFAKAVRNRKQAAPHIVFMSGRANVPMTVSALRLGAVDFFAKPLRIAELVARIRTLVELPPVAAVRAPIRDTANRPESRKESDARRAWALRELEAIGRRRKILGAQFEIDPGWIMLLELFDAHSTQRPYHVSALCLASGAPHATALRRLSQMIDAGLFRREQDPADARRSWVFLTPEGLDKVSACAELEHTGS
ncbi:response regulator [Vineibacter terrae]|uniref:Response regulator n=2 Tax=Vineibacter terrae TaxID=2586908 RepID=A0A5C8PRA3_9HYPH|nr:response regulator [Vineibacter terrae]